MFKLLGILSIVLKEHIRAVQLWKGWLLKSVLE